MWAAGSESGWQARLGGQPSCGNQSRGHSLLSPASARELTRVRRGPAHYWQDVQVERSLEWSSVGTSVRPGLALRVTFTGGQLARLLSHPRENRTAGQGASLAPFRILPRDGWQGPENAMRSLKSGMGGRRREAQGRAGDRPSAGPAPKHVVTTANTIY